VLLFSYRYHAWQRARHSNKALLVPTANAIPAAGLGSSTDFACPRRHALTKSE
jgi:hypothetical protein